jgi:hypothetical protein
MNDLLSLLPTIGSLAFFVVWPVMLAWLLGGSGPVDLTELFHGASPPPWPRGVQEHDLPPFRLDRFGGSSVRGMAGPLPPDSLPRCPSTTIDPASRRRVSPAWRSRSALPR